MIRVLPGERGGAVVEATLLRQPAIYLDQDSLADIAKTAGRRKRFLSIWKNKGELLFSWISALDVAGPQGRSSGEIRSFLESLGPYWIPLEMNPWKVARKENGTEASSGTPVVSESFLQGYFLELRHEVENLGRVVDLVHADRDNMIAQADVLKQKVADLVRHAKAAAVANPASLERSADWPFDASRPVTCLMREMGRLIGREAKQYAWMPNDGIDLLHALIAGSVADFLLVDKQWKRRLEAVAPAKAYPWVYYRYEIDAFLAAFERCKVGPAPA